MTRVYCQYLPMRRRFALLVLLPLFMMGVGLVPRVAAAQTWQYVQTDYSDMSCPITDPSLAAYGAMPDCPTTSPGGTACSSPGTDCKVNTVQGCTIKTDVYSCPQSPYCTTTPGTCTQTGSTWVEATNYAYSGTAVQSWGPSASDCLSACENSGVSYCDEEVDLNLTYATATYSCTAYNPVTGAQSVPSQTTVVRGEPTSRKSWNAWSIQPTYSCTNPTQTCQTPVNGACGSANGQTYPYGSSGYGSYSQCSAGSPSTTAFPSAGSSQSWTCSGSYGGSTSGTCSASQAGPASCPATTINNCNLAATGSGGSSGSCASGYSAGSCSYTCSNGSWSGNSNSCAPASCSLPWGGSISSGQSVTAYQASSVNAPATCSAETRTCSNGALSGSYQYQGCSVANQPPNTPSVYGLYDSSGSTYYGSSAPSYPPNSYRVYASATDPNGDNVDYYIQMYNNQTGAYSGNWTGWVGSGGWNWDNFLQSAGPGWYAFRAYAEDPSGATSGWSGWYWVSLYNVSCTSGANACGQTNAGVIVNGACNASAPSNASCPAAAASISVSPTPVNYRQNYTVSWSCTNSSSASLYWKQQGGGWNAAWPSEPASGSLTDSTIYSPTIYDVDCHAYNGATVSAQATQTLNPPTASLSASPTTINEGDSSTLSWSSSNATSCTGTGFGTGGATGGSASTGALATPGPYNYQLSCTGPGGSVNSFASVTVRSPQVTIGASPDRVPAGGSITVSWTGSGVDSCSISKNGSAWKQNLAADGNGNLSGSAPDTVTGQTTYAITCTGGTAATAASGSAIVNVASNFKEF